MSLRSSLFFILIPLVFSSLPPFVYGRDYQGSKSENSKDGVAGHTQDYPSLPGIGKKVPLGGGHYLLYGFNKKPKLGTVIMKVEIFTGEGKKDTSFEVKADAGMPSMKGAHETGDRPFALSKKGDYLLPINIVMPGDWEIRLIIIKAGKVILRGRYNFDV